MKQDVRLPPRREPPVWEQSDVECCTSCALTACLEAKHPDYEKLSPIFHYHKSMVTIEARRALIEKLTKSEMVKAIMENQAISGIDPL